MNKTCFLFMHSGIIRVITDGLAEDTFEADENSTTLTPMFNTLDQMEDVPPTVTTSGGHTVNIPGEFLLTDTNGDVTTFFDVGRSTSNFVSVTGTTLTVPAIYTGSSYAQEVANDGGTYYQLGAFKSYQDAYGNTTTAVYDPGTGRLDKVDHVDSPTGECRGPLKYPNSEDYCNEQATVITMPCSAPFVPVACSTTGGF